MNLVCVQQHTCLYALYDYHTTISPGCLQFDQLVQLQWLFNLQVTGQSPSIAKILTLHYNKEGKCSEKVRLKLALSEGAVVPSRSNFNKYTHDEAMLRRRSLDEKMYVIGMHFISVYMGNGQIRRHFGLFRETLP